MDILRQGEIVFYQFTERAEQRSADYTSPAICLARV